MHIVRHTLAALAITTALALAACSSGQDQATTNQPATTGTSPAPTAAKPLTADQVNVQMALQGTPALSADGQFVDVTVDLANHGKTTLTSTGLDPVNLGAHSVDANGTVVENDLARAAIPDTVPSSQATVTIQLPVDKVIGKSAQILPVQEGVSWFDAWGTKPLTVGPFNTCAKPATGKVCNADGMPLATAKSTE